MLYALYKNDVFVRTQDFTDTPPILSPLKGMEWRPYTPPPPPDPSLYVPDVVSRFQAKAALQAAGQLAAVQTVVNNANAFTKLAWTEVNEFRRSSPTIAAMKQALGWTDAFVDQLFKDAAKIEA